MSTETEIMGMQEQDEGSAENKIKENEYRIFEYFKDNTGMLITCVSAMVAVVSWLLRFAVGRMNYAYLSYWNIASLHANVSNSNELYMVAGVLAFTLVLMIIRSILSKLSDTFRYYVPLLLLTDRSVRLSKKEKHEFLKEMRRINMRLSRLPSRKKKSAEGIAIRKEIEEHCKRTKDELKDILDVKKARESLRFLVILQILSAVFLLYLLGSMCALLISASGTIRENIPSFWMVALFIIIGLLCEYVPVYMESKRTCKQYKDEEVFSKVRELLKLEIPKFPLAALKNWEIKTMLTDAAIKSAMASIITGLIFIVFLASFLGTLNAKVLRSFPMYTDGQTSYAVVYTSGSTRFLEEAAVQDEVLVINTAKQRVITSEDFSYSIETFDGVSVVETDEADEIEKDSMSIKKVVTAVVAFVKTMWTKIGEVFGDNAECIPRT